MSDGTRGETTAQRSPGGRRGEVSPRGAEERRGWGPEDGSGAAGDRRWRAFAGGRGLGEGPTWDRRKWAQKAHRMIAGPIGEGPRRSSLGVRRVPESLLPGYEGPTASPEMG